MPNSDLPVWRAADPWGVLASSTAHGLSGHCPLGHLVEVGVCLWCAAMHWLYLCIILVANLESGGVAL